MEAAEERLKHMMAAYGTRLLRLCAVVLKDAALAEDAAQDTYLKAWKKLHTLKEMDSEEAWLMRIGLNTCRDYLRTAWLRRVDRRVPLDSLPEPAQEMKDPDDTVLQAVLSLRTADRAAIMMRYDQGLPIAQIAEALHLSPGAVKARLRRANQQLRRQLERWYYDED